MAAPVGRPPATAGRERLPARGQRRLVPRAVSRADEAGHSSGDRRPHGSSQAWRYLVEGITGHVIPVYLLDTPGTGKQPLGPDLDRPSFNGGDNYYRLCQEAVLGTGGVEILPKLGHHHTAAELASGAV